jgi:hypothetical protein
MSSPSDDTSASGRARRGLRDALVARFGAPDVDIRWRGAWTTMFTVARHGDTVMCLRLNTADSVKVARTVECADAMLAYCERANLASCVLVVAEASGRASHADRLDLGLIEDKVEQSCVSRVLWHDVAAISRSPECAWAHLAALGNAGAELHLLMCGRIDVERDSIALNLHVGMSCGLSESMRRRTTSALMARADAGRALWGSSE